MALKQYLEKTNPDDKTKIQGCFVWPPFGNVSSHESACSGGWRDHERRSKKVVADTAWNKEETKGWVQEGHMRGNCAEYGPRRLAERDAVEGQHESFRL